MTALPLVNPDTATGRTAELFTEVQRRLGATPNMTRAMAVSPALLDGYLALSGALAKGRLRAPVREEIALAVAQANRCDYCLSAHSYLAEHVAHLPAEAVRAARRADSTDPRTAALLRLAVRVNDTRGDLDDADLEAARAAGAGDEEIAETLGHVALNVLTNYFNKVAAVEVDFPLVTA